MLESFLLAIRGATTIESDCESDIRARSLELFDAILSLNNLKLEDITAVLASTTDDITAFYPVTAIRQSRTELYNTAFFSCLEPNILGGLSKCIRLLVFTKSIGDVRARHIYLRGAKNLRGHYNIAIDGPSGAGKSTAARELAKRLNIAYLDTGAMYRAAGLYAKLNSLLPLNEENAAKVAHSIDLDIRLVLGSQRVFLGGEDVTDRLYVEEISLLGNQISRFEIVREVLTKYQREIAAKMSCVLDGRDIGSLVLPNAEYKFFITADVKKRAQRRFLELQQKGIDTDFQRVLNEIELRDKNDSTRKIAPLIQTKDAILIDTTNLTCEQTIEKILSYL